MRRLALTALLLIGCGDVAPDIEEPCYLCRSRETYCIENGIPVPCVGYSQSVCFAWWDGVCLDTGEECATGCDEEGSAVGQ